MGNKPNTKNKAEFASKTQGWFHKAIKGWDESLRELLKAKLHLHICLAHLVGWNPTFQWFFVGFSTFLRPLKVQSFLYWENQIPASSKILHTKIILQCLDFRVCLPHNPLVEEVILKKSCLGSPDSKHKKSWTKIEMETQWNTFNSIWNIAPVSDSNEFQRWATYYYFIHLFLYFFIWKTL